MEEAGGRGRVRAGERGGSHSVCGERSFLNGPSIRGHFVCTRVLSAAPPLLGVFFPPWLRVKVRDAVVNRF